jgi:hypothetical protein
VFFQSAAIPGLLSCAERWGMVLEQGEYSLIWDDEPRMVSTLAPMATNEEGIEIVKFVFNAQNQAEDITLF